MYGRKGKEVNSSYHFMFFLEICGNAFLTDVSEKNSIIKDKGKILGVSPETNWVCFHPLGSKRMILHLICAREVAGKSE